MILCQFVPATKSTTPQQTNVTVNLERSSSNQRGHAEIQLALWVNGGMDMGVWTSHARPTATTTEQIVCAQILGISASRGNTTME